MITLETLQEQIAEQQLRLATMESLHIALLDACLRIGSNWELPQGMGGYRKQVLDLAHQIERALDPSLLVGPMLG